MPSHTWFISPTVFHMGRVFTEDWSSALVGQKHCHVIIWNALIHADRCQNEFKFVGQDYLSNYDIYYTRHQIQFFFGTMLSIRFTSISKCDRRPFALTRPDHQRGVHVTNDKPLKIVNVYGSSSIRRSFDYFQKVCTQEKQVLNICC